MRCQGGRADVMLLERWVKHEDSSRVTSDRSPFQPLGGGCMCERVRFEIAEPLLGALYCHCKRCQRRTGSAFSVTAATAPGSFKIVQGAELVGSWRPPDGWEKFFCTECGSQLYKPDRHADELRGRGPGPVPSHGHRDVDSQPQVGGRHSRRSHAA